MRKRGDVSTPTHTEEEGGWGGVMTTLSDDDGSVGLLRSEDLDVLGERC